MQSDVPEAPKDAHVVRVITLIEWSDGTWDATTSAGNEPVSFARYPQVALTEVLRHFVPDSFAEDGGGHGHTKTPVAE